MRFESEIELFISLEINKQLKTKVMPLWNENLKRFEKFVLNDNMGKKKELISTTEIKHICNNYIDLCFITFIFIV